MKLEFTHVVIVNLKPRDGKKLDVRDDPAGRNGVRNLVLRVHVSGHKVFFYVYSLNGCKRWYRIGDYSAVGLSKARAEAKRLASDVSAGRDPQSEKAAASAVDTFGTIYERYLEEWAKRRNKSWAQADYLVRTHVLPRWGQLKITAVARRNALALHSLLSKDRPMLANTVLAAASKVFSWAIGQEILTTGNPCRLIAMNPANERDRVLSDAEMPLFWREFDREELLVGTVLKLMLLTGQRGIEVRHMRLELIEDGCFWKLPGKPIKNLGWPGTKNGKDHGVCLSGKARELISELSVSRPTAGYVFAAARGKVTLKLDKAMRAINKRLEIADPVTPHDLRRTFATRAGEVGARDQDIDRVLNHATPQVGVSRVLRTYNRHTYEAEHKWIMEAVANKIAALVEGRREDNVVAIWK